MIWAMLLDESSKESQFSAAASNSKKSESTSYYYLSNSKYLCFSSSQAGGLSIILVYSLQPSACPFFLGRRFCLFVTPGGFLGHFGTFGSRNVK